MRPAVDVLIPSLDRPSALARAIDSVQAVSAAEPEIEVHVHVVDRDAGSASGPAAARNVAARRGSAEFLALLDDDDVWIAPRLGRALELLGRRPDVALVAGDAEMPHGGRFLRGAVPEGGLDFGHADLLLDCRVCASTVTLRRRDWEQAGGMDERLLRAEDYELWLRLTRPGLRAMVLPDLLARRGEAGPRLSSDPVAMATATLTAIEVGGLVDWRDAALRDRIGRLQAVRAHGALGAGDVAFARRLAARALLLAPSSLVAWTAAARALTSRRRRAGLAADSSAL